MFEFMQSTPPVASGGIGRATKFRLAALSGARNGVGIWEFELYDGLNRNLCRTTGLVPTATASTNASGNGGAISTSTMATYPPPRSIDGGYGNWVDTCYINTMADGSSYLEYTFPTPVEPVWWRMIPEGTWVPDANGMKLLMLTSEGWKEVVGVSDASNWASRTWREFRDLELV